MKKQDNLSTYMKELPKEEPSANFTRLVMERVMLEPIKSPAIYQPLINSKLWWKIFIGAVMFCLGAYFLYNYFPENDIPAVTPSFYHLELSFVIMPFQWLSNTMNNISLQFIGCAGAISLLLFVDQLYTRLTDREA